MHIQPLCGPSLLGHDRAINYLARFPSCLKMGDLQVTNECKFKSTADSCSEGLSTARLMGSAWKLEAIMFVIEKHFLTHCGLNKAWAIYYMY